MPASDLNQYGYDPRSRRYRHGPSGRFIAEKDVRVAVDVVIDAETQVMRQHAQDMIDGKINFAEWQLRSLSTLKTLHVAVALAGNGGIANTSPSDLAYIGNLVKEQYKFFRNMVADIKQGKQALDGTLLARVALYGQAARGTHEAVRGRAAKNGNAQFERNVLGASDHCHGAPNGCIEQEQRGWVPVGTLVPIGQRLCLVNCRCSITYR